MQKEQEFTASLNYHELAKMTERFIKHIQEDNLDRQDIIDELEDLKTILENSQRVEKAHRDRIKQRDQLLYYCMLMYGVRPNFKLTKDGKTVLNSFDRLQDQYTLEERQNAYAKMIKQLENKNY